MRNIVVAPYRPLYKTAGQIVGVVMSCVESGLSYERIEEMWGRVDIPGIRVKVRETPNGYEVRVVRIRGKPLGKREREN